MNWTDSLNKGPRVVALGDCDVEVLHWAYAPHLPDNVPHRHTYFEICLVGDYGSGIFTVQNDDYSLSSCDLFIARPGVIHQIRNSMDDNMELFWVSFILSPTLGASSNNSSSEHRQLLEALRDSSSLVVPDQNGCITSLWRALMALAGAPARAGYRLQVQNTMSSLLLAIAQAGAGDMAPGGAGFSGSVENNVAQLAIRYVHDNLYRRLPIAEIAAHVHVSPRHLSRLFAEVTGTSPAAYIEHARIDRARALLRDTGMPIKTVAAQVGYSDVHQFTRAFRRHNKIAPAGYRRNGPIGNHVPAPGQFM